MWTLPFMVDLPIENCDFPWWCKFTRGYDSLVSMFCGMIISTVHLFSTWWKPHLSGRSSHTMLIRHFGVWWFTTLHRKIIEWMPIVGWFLPCLSFPGRWSAMLRRIPFVSRYHTMWRIVDAKPYVCLNKNMVPMFIYVLYMYILLYTYTYIYIYIHQIHMYTQREIER